jgi:CheY-like chemotaxis protein
MRKKCALIVDDSKTAREMLAKRLVVYDIDIVKVDSAANAIDYLYSNTPDAIFMDYEMPGMDGFQALRVIKSNPNTATIPVMMYTSKAGDLALGEARALGAIGVLPKQMGPQNLDVIVQQLHLLPDQVSLVEVFHEQGEQQQVGGRLNYPPQASANVEYLDKSKSRPERLEYHTEAYDESLFVYKRQTKILQKDLLTVEQRLRDLFSREFSKLREDYFSAELRVQELARVAKWKLRLSLFTSLSALVLLSVLWWRLTGLIEDFNSEVTRVSKGLSTLETSVESDQFLLQSDLSEPNSTTSGTGKQVGVALLEWAANRGTQFQYGENPYEDNRILWLSELVQQLNEAGFQGAISLQAYYGDFCLTRGETGIMTLANDQMSSSECVFSSHLDDSGFSKSSYQTIGFANFINSLAAEEGSPIEIFVEPDAVDDPLVAYPERYSVKTAGEWNRVAVQNQRIQVSLFPKNEL